MTPAGIAVTVTIGSTVVLSLQPDETLIQQLPLAETAAVTGALAAALAMSVAGLAVPIAEMAAACAPPAALTGAIMSKNITIKLAEPITGHKGEIKELVYRPPRFKDILLVGEAYTVHSSKDGERFIVENQEAIQHYAEVCLVEPAEYSLVEAQLGITDALRVKEEIMGFFLRAAQAGAELKTLEKT